MLDVPPSETDKSPAITEQCLAQAMQVSACLSVCMRALYLPDSNAFQTH